MGYDGISDEHPPISINVIQFLTTAHVGMSQGMNRILVWIHPIICQISQKTSIQCTRKSQRLNWSVHYVWGVESPFWNSFLLQNSVVSNPISVSNITIWPQMIRSNLIQHKKQVLFWGMFIFYSGKGLLLYNKMQPTNLNAHTYVNGTDAETHGYAVMQNTCLKQLI